MWDRTDNISADISISPPELHGCFFVEMHARQAVLAGFLRVFQFCEKGCSWVKGGIAKSHCYFVWLSCQWKLCVSDIFWWVPWLRCAPGTKRGWGGVGGLEPLPVYLPATCTTHFQPTTLPSTKKYRTKILKRAKKITVFKQCCVPAFWSQQFCLRQSVLIQLLSLNNNFFWD